MYIYIYIYVYIYIYMYIFIYNNGVSWVLPNLQMTIH